MEPTTIDSFTGMESMHVSSIKASTSGTTFIALIQSTPGSSCYFQFAMYPAQARAMAAALIEHAEAAEANAPSV